MLNDRRQTIVNLLAATSAVAQQLSGLVADNEKELAPTLEKLNSVTAMLEKNRDSLATVTARSDEILLTQGEIVANGAVLQRAYVPNLILGTASPAVPGLRLRVPARRQRRPAAGQRRSACRTPIPGQRDSAARRPSQ